MRIVHVDIRVKQEHIQEFIHETALNARSSLREPGVLRFDFIQQQDDTSRFVLVEIYKDEDAAASHKETAHYRRWRDAVAPMMAEARSSRIFKPLFPEEMEWK